MGEQVALCKRTAQENGLHVVQIYSDEGLSGHSLERPSLQQMTAFLAQQNEQFAVIVSDTSRLARELSSYIQIRQHISEAGAVLVTPDAVYDDSADSRFIESVIVSAAQLESHEEQDASISQG